MADGKLLDGCRVEILEGFRVERMTEVYRMNEDGRYISTLGCFSTEGLARAYARGLRDPDYTQTREVVVLTNGKVGYFVEDEALVMDEAKVREEVRGRVRGKLTADELEVLGL